MAEAKKKTTRKPKAKKTIRPTGRPELYSEELALTVLTRIAEGESLRKIAGHDDMPSIFTIYKWIETVEGFSERYARAKQDAADSLAEDIQDIGDKTLKGFYEPAAARVAIDAYKWTAAKLKPKKYGDKLEVDSTVKHTLAEKSEDELNKLVQGYLEGIKGGKAS